MSHKRSLIGLPKRGLIRKCPVAGDGIAQRDLRFFMANNSCGRASAT